MKNNINKYFAGELTSGEKDEFLLEVIHDGGLQEDIFRISASGSTNRLVVSERG